MTYRKKLIEVALPLEAINAASAREKSIRRGHPSTLHLWWARRPLAACRAVIFASLVDDPNDPDAPPEFVEACRKLPRGRNAAEKDTPRQRLFDFIETLVLWESTTDEQVLETARHLIRLATDGNPPPLLDPFAGGGSIPLEAQRLGLEAHASDLNPVAVMINKALIEIPPKFADMPPVNPRDREKMGGGAGWKGIAGLAADVRYYGEWMCKRAWERIGRLYPCGPNGETVLAWRWARTVRSPDPVVDAHVPLLRSFWLCKKKGRQAWIEPIVDKRARKIQFAVRVGEGAPPPGTMARNGGRCLISGAPITYKYIRKEGKAGRMGIRLLAMMAQAGTSRRYYAPSAEHEKAASLLPPEHVPDSDLPEQALGFRVQLYGFRKHRDLFTARQLWMLNTLCGLIDEVYQLVLDHSDRNGPYAAAVSSYLALAIGRYADYGSTMTYWDDRGPSIQKTFGLPTLQMRWDFPETNPFAGFSGNWTKMVESVGANLDMLPASRTKAYARQEDATRISAGPMRYLLSTDPPYYDNIGYAALSDYFYVWLRQAVGQFYPDLFSTLLTPKEREIIAEPARHESTHLASKFFEHELFQVFDRASGISDTDYPMSVFYAFRQSETSEGGDTASTGWEVFLSGLIQSGFQITSTWPLRTEQSGGLRLVGRNALASSVVLTCRPRSNDAPMTSRREFVTELRRELPYALREMQSGNIAPVDLAQASIGPGMAVYSRYSKVLEPNGDHLTVRTALQIINRELDAYLAEQEGYIDEDSRFALAWFEQFGFQEGPFGQADVLARAKNTSVDGLAYAGVLRSGAGKVQLHHWSELDPGWDPATDKRLTVWEAVHHLIERLHIHGEEGAAMLLAKMPSDLAAQSRQLAYRLYSICDRKGWAENARDYNALVISWSASQEQAREYREQYQQGTLL